MNELGKKVLGNNKSVLWAYHIEAGNKATEIDVSGVIAAQRESGFTWVHMQCDAKGAKETMHSLGLPQQVIESLEAIETRPKTIAINDGLLVYLRGINKNPDADPEDMVSLRIWITAKGIISARRKDRKLLSVQDVREQLDAGNIPINCAQLMLDMIERIADRIHEMVDDLDEELVIFETAEQMNSQARQRLSVVRRQAAAIRRYLTPQRDALDALYRINKLLSSDQAFALREQTDRMTRYVEDLDLARERSIVLQDEVRNRLAEQQGAKMYVLSLVTAIFLPLSFLTGVFGMNVAGLPGLEEPGAFNYLALGMAGLAVVLFTLMMWKKWF
ncbi:MAG: zinc transporter [Paraglaciecola sp.]|jgi:zinc transporter